MNNTASTTANGICSRLLEQEMHSPWWHGRYLWYLEDKTYATLSCGYSEQAKLLNPDESESTPTELNNDHLNFTWILRVGQMMKI